MGVAQALTEDDALAAMGFGSESKQASRHQHALGFAQQRREIGQIDHRVCGEDQIGAGVGLAAQARYHLRHFQLCIKPRHARPLDHARRQIDSDERIDLPGERARGEPGAAAEVDGAFEECRFADGGARGEHGAE